MSTYLKPLVAIGIRFLGPGSLRLRLVKLSHGLSDHATTEEPPVIARSNQARFDSEAKAA